MPMLFARLRSLRRSKTNSTPVVESIETGIVTHHAAHDDDGAQVSQDASPDSPSQNVELLDNKIFPDLSALFASVEDALRNVDRDAEVQKGSQLFEDTESENDYGNERAGTRPADNGALYASFESGNGIGWSTFGQDASPSASLRLNAHIARRDKAKSANFRPASADAVLSWSPNQIERSSDSLRPSSLSYSSPALYPSPEIQQSTQQSVYYSPSPRTFGYPTPPHFTPTDTPAFPAPAFQSTPKSSTPQSRPRHRRSPRASARSRLAGLVGPLPSRIPRMKRTNSEQPRLSERLSSVAAIEAPGRKQTSIRTSTSVPRAPNRRKSAEWNAHAASAGVVADPRQTTEFGWPAEVSREILRLSLGEHAMATHAQDAPRMREQPEKADSKSRDGPHSNFKRGGPRVSHDRNKVNIAARQLIRSSISEQRLSSANLYSTNLPPSSSAPGRSDASHTLATQDARTLSSAAPSVAVEKTANSRSQSSGEDAKQDTKMGAPGAAEHKRSESEERIDWGSEGLQEFISREEDFSGDVSLLQPSTPMKKSESESTYQTAGSSSFLHAPSLSVIAATPRSSPGGSRHNSGVLPEAGDGLQVPTPPAQTAINVKGKRKADESEEGSPPDLRGSQSKKTSFKAEAEARPSNASRAPSSFQSQKSRKRVRLSSPAATPDFSRPGSTAAPPHLGSVSSRGSSHAAGKTVPPRPASRTSRISRAMSASASSVAFPHRRSLSQGSIPISAIVTPRAPSIDRLSTFHMRDPRRPPPARDVGWSLRFASSYEDQGSPVTAWAFWFGFLFPLLWWVGSFWRIPRTRMVGTDTEKAVIVDDPFYEREARAWRLRCRIASVVFFVTYAPVIILLAVLVPRS